MRDLPESITRSVTVSKVRISSVRVCYDELAPDGTTVLCSVAVNIPAKSIGAALLSACEDVAASNTEATRPAIEGR